MTREKRHQGFSLTEVLLATGILAVGLVMIAMVFPVGVKLTSVATERTIATTAANEAFAKMKLYGTDPDKAGTTYAGIDLSAISSTTWTYPFSQALYYASKQKSVFPPAEQWYPSDLTQEKKYRWVAMVRKVNNSQLQATVFVTRMLTEGASYYALSEADGTTILTQGSEPNAVPINLEKIEAKKFTILASNTTLNHEYQFCMEGSVLLEKTTGELYRVVEMKKLADGSPVLTLDKDISSQYTGFWIVSPAVGSKRNPCIGVYQRILTF